MIVVLVLLVSGMGLYWLVKPPSSAAVDIEPSMSAIPLPDRAKVYIAVKKQRPQNVTTYFFDRKSVRYMTKSKE